MNIAAMQRDLATKKSEIESLLASQMTAAETEQRDRTADEIASVDAKITDAKTLKARIERAQSDASLTEEVERLTAGLVVTEQQTATPARQTRSMGAQLVGSEEYRRFIKGNGHRRSGAWISPAIELQATTLDTTNSGGGQLLFPQVLPTIIPILTRRLVVSDLLPQGQTDSNAIMFLKETTYTNAAAATAEGGTKPESALAFAQSSSPVQKIAHWLPVTEEMLEDYPAMQAYIDARLRLGLDLTEEDELLNGNGTPPHLTGLMTVSGMTATQAAGGDSTADAVFKEITKIATTAFIQPDGIVMNPTNWQTVQLTKNANGNYMGAGPWNAPQAPTLWGYPVVNTPAMTLGTALVGAFAQCAQEFHRGGVRVEATNSHSDFFVKNLIAIRAEERLALAVYRPAGFGKVTGLV